MVQSSDAQTGLQSSNDMLAFMENALRELEEAQGSEDPQARAQLDKLRQQTASLSQAGCQAQHQKAAAPQELDELAIARQLDDLDGQLKKLEESVASADPATQQLFGQGTALWLQQQRQQGPDT